MKISASWLQDWVEHGLPVEELAQRLTMLGLEVDALAPVAQIAGPLVVGRVLDVRRHPNADKLSLCKVDVGSGEPLDIVCGARNVRSGGVYATALVGAKLPGGMVIKAAKIRGEASAGMLCSATELGLESTAEGLMDLDEGAQPGTDAIRLLQLDDHVLDINVTPNRADCFGVLGIAREIGAGTGRPVRALAEKAVPTSGSDQLPLKVIDAADCPRFAGRIVRGLRTDATTPLWMRERLRRCGIRPIHPVVDVTNYVMLELGQPMHAYDLALLQGGITVRRAQPGEKLELLDGQEVTVSADVLTIADAAGPVGLAGIMGGRRTAVSASTVDIFLESAHFAPAALAGRARRFGLHTDASVRFERGVDPTIQVTAIEMATRHILAIAGGQPGPVSEIAATRELHQKTSITLRRARLAAVLGATVADAQVERILAALGFAATRAEQGWAVTAPAWRFDIAREEDLIEEIARVHGYEQIPASPERAALRPAATAEAPDALAPLVHGLVARGYQEAITYSFVEPVLAQRFGAQEAPQLQLSNPISSDLAAMRQSLWPGLVKAARDNLHRQQDRVRLFEVGARFVPCESGSHREEKCIAGIVVGARMPEQWGARREGADFFDAKNDVEALLRLAGVQSDGAAFVAAAHPALHPGRCARVTARGQEIGWVGELHPALARDLDMPGTLLFELDAAALTARSKPAYRQISKYPSVRRDIAVLVPIDVPVDALLATAKTAAAETLHDAFIFDIYTGQQIGNAEKSVAIGLILQDTSRTLTDVDADGIVQAVRVALGQQWQARIRE